MKYYFQENPGKKDSNFISGSIDLITKFDLTKQYKKFCSTTSQKLHPAFDEYLKDIPGTIDTTADNTLRDSIFGPQPPEMDRNSLTIDDLKVNFTLDDEPIEPGLFDVEDIQDEELEKTEQADASSKGSKFIIRLPSLGSKIPASSEFTDTVATASDTKKRKSEKKEEGSKKKIK